MLIADTYTTSFKDKISNFPEEVYKFKKSDHLTKLMLVLLGDAGVGQLVKIQLMSRLSETLDGTRFSDLDAFYGLTLRFPRLQDEIYPYEPFTGALDSVAWSSVYIADAKYRSRLRLFMLALTKGPTVEGLSLASESVLGVRCEILEAWRFIDGVGLTSYPGRMSALPDRKEFLVVPHLLNGTTLDQSKKRVLINVLQSFKPADTVCSVSDTSGTANGYLERDILSAKSSSEYYEIRRDVLPVTVDSRISTTNYSFVSNSTSVEAPNIAFQSQREIVIDLNPLIVRTESPVTIETGSDVTSWTDWSDIETANSPDNFPNGINDDGIFSWSSQSEYEAYWIRYILSLGGQADGNRYRLPYNTNQTLAQIVSSEQVLARNSALRITTSWYGSMI
jgi:hypothetical protein